MALNKYNLKRWWNMFRGKSMFHVNQEIGKCFDTDAVRGYYNDLTEKVTRQPELLESDALPLHKTQQGDNVYFPVAVFQYGLGAYDLFLQTKDDRYYQKFLQCLNWTADNQMKNGAWNNFFFNYPDHPYGAMAQGEGASLLIRGYKETGNQRFLDAARTALDFMLVPVEEGGATLYEGDGVILLEYTHLPAVMNGWIFAWWGLYDFVLATGDKGSYRKSMEDSLNALEQKMKSFTTSYWSNYDLGGRLAGPFYHHLHIAQMQAMWKLTGHAVFQDYADRWTKFEGKRLNRFRAFCVKAIQKIKEK